MRAGHTYRAARRNACREGGVLAFWRLTPYRVWQRAKGTGNVVLVRPMPPVKKVAT